MVFKSSTVCTPSSIPVPRLHTLLSVRRCGSLCPLNSFLFHRVHTPLIAYPFLDIKPLLEEGLGFVAGHLEYEDAVHDVPDGLGVLLAGLHVDVD